MILYALVLDGVVWGFGDTEARACEDAWDQVTRAVARGDAATLEPAVGPPELRVIDRETAKRVAHGERRWDVLHGRGPNPPPLH